VVPERRRRVFHIFSFSVLLAVWAIYDYPCHILDEGDNILDEGDNIFDDEGDNILDEGDKEMNYF
jgi:hypothetical protein